MLIKKSSDFDNICAILYHFIHALATCSLSPIKCRKCTTFVWQICISSSPWMKDLCWFCGLLWFFLFLFSVCFRFGIFLFVGLVWFVCNCLGNSKKKKKKSIFHSKHKRIKDSCMRQHRFDLWISVWNGLPRHIRFIQFRYQNTVCYAQPQTSCIGERTRPVVVTFTDT